MRNAFIVTLSILCGLGSCSLFEPDRLIIWTDRPEFALYVDCFNTSQNKYKAEAYYFETVAHKTASSFERPDIIAGSWLKSETTAFLFKPLDKLFKTGALNKSAFYLNLLEQGVINGEQFLLPVSFNISALVFMRNNAALLSNPFTISLEEAKELGKAYNIVQKGAYTRMGFSPDWNDEFLFAGAVLRGADFHGTDALLWNADALGKILEYDKKWIIEANTSFQAVDDFVFKYFYDPPVKRVMQGRILFTYMNSAEFFTLDYDQQAGLDFRWLEEEKRIPLIESSVYYGLYRKGRANKGAETFTAWFFSPETQKTLLENNRKNQLNAILFGVAGGFSAIQNVTEEIFPRFYPNLLGHVPPDAFLSPPDILPQNWLAVKERVVIPYIREYIRAEESILPLDRRITDWYRINK
jgi:hypothetical protein